MSAAPAESSRRSRRGSLRRVLAMAVAGIATAVLAAACGGTGAGSGASASGITIAYVANTADQQLATVVEQAGLFKKYGLDVTVKFMQQSAFQPALTAGQIQFGLVSAPSAALQTINGSPNVWVAQFESALNLSLVAGPKVTGVRDLDGKSIGISSTGGSSDLLAQLAMKQSGISAHSVPLGNLQNDFTALASGQIDSAILGPPLTYNLAAKLPGAHTLIDFSTEKNSLPGLGLVAYGSWLQNNGPTVEKVLRAFVDGVKYFKANPDPVKQIIAKAAAGSSQSDVDKAYQAAVDMLDERAVPATDTQQKLLDLLADKYPQAKGFDVNKLVDPTYMNKILSS